MKFFQVRRGMLVAVGHHGIRVMPVQRATDRRSIFEFMASSVSSFYPETGTHPLN